MPSLKSTSINSLNKVFPFFFVIYKLVERDIDSLIGQILRRESIHRNLKKRNVSQNRRSSLFSIHEETYVVTFLEFYISILNCPVQ